MSQNKVVSSLAYQFANVMANKGVGFLIGIVLARLLAPEVFGEVALLTVFINLSQIFVQSGLNTALIQRQDIDEDDCSTVFFFSTALACPLVLLLAVGAPLIASWLESPAIVAPLRAYAPVLLFGGYQSVQVARLQKKMNFKALMIANLIATLSAGALGVACAACGLGIWALVIYYFSATVFSCFTMFWTDRWIPRRHFSFARAKVLFSFGWKMLVSALLCSLYSDVRSLIIGKRYSTETLAYYNRGQQFPGVISVNLDNTVQSVMFPAMAVCQEDREQMREMLRKTISFSAVLSVPAMVGLALVAEPLVRLVLGEQWMPCVPYMQWICLAEASFSFSSSNLVAIKALGRSDVYMKLEIVRRTVMLGILLISVCCFSSALAIAVGYAVSYWLDWLIVTVAVKKLLHYGFFRQLRDTWNILASACLMGAAVVLVAQIPLPSVPQLLLRIVIGFATYAGACLLFRVKSVREILTRIRQKRSRSV